MFAPLFHDNKLLKKLIYTDFIYITELKMKKKRNKKEIIKGRNARFMSLFMSKFRGSDESL